MLGVAVAAAATALALATPASAASPAVSPAVSVSAPLVTGLAGPLGLSVKGDGTIYVAQSFAGILTTVAPDGTRRDLVHAPGEIAGLLARSNSSAVYTFTGGTQRHPVTTLNKVTLNGEVTQLGDLYAHELQDNPDAHANYGFQGLSAACARKVPAQVGGGRPYGGQVDSHPYAVAELPDGAFAVADAAANAILRVQPNHRVSTIAVLPPQPYVVTAPVARSLHLPPCTVGRMYNVEPVPTDVTVGPDGKLYVTTLPGGPESGALAARGSVYRVDATSGRAIQVATGFLGATNLAIDAHNRIYVTELFAGRVSYVDHGRAVPLVSRLSTPAAIDFARGHLYVTVDLLGSPSAPPDGKVVRINV